MRLMKVLICALVGAVIGVALYGCDAPSATTNQLRSLASEPRPLASHFLPTPTMHPMATETAVCAVVSKYADGSAILAASMKDGTVFMGTVTSTEKVACEVLVPPPTKRALKPTAKPKPPKERSLVVRPKAQTPSPCDLVKPKAAKNSCAK